MSEGSQDTYRFAKTCDGIEKLGIPDLQSYSHHLRPVLFFSPSRIISRGSLIREKINFGRKWITELTSKSK